MRLNVIFSPAPHNRSLTPAQQQTTKDAIRFASEIGFRPILFDGLLKRPSYYAKLIASWNIARAFLALYPLYARACFATTNPLRDLDVRLLDFLNELKRRRRSILFLDDLPICQTLALGKRERIDERSYEIEEKIFRLFDILCVYNEAAKRAISERYGIPLDKFVEIGLRDYGVRPSQLRPIKSLPNKWNLVCVGNGERVYSGEWASNLPPCSTISYEFLGVNWDWISQVGRHDLTHGGVMSPQELSDHISKHAHFGIVAYSRKINSYSRYTCPSKLATYLSTGLPILVHSECEYVAALVRRYEIGISLASFKDLPGMIQNLTECDYQNMRRNCAQLAEKITSGYYFKRAVKQALSKLNMN
jgi:hypothetical protein